MAQQGQDEQHLATVKEMEADHARQRDEAVAEHEQAVKTLKIQHMAEIALRDKRLNERNEELKAANEELKAAKNLAQERDTELQQALAAAQTQTAHQQAVTDAQKTESATWAAEKAALEADLRKCNDALDAARGLATNREAQYQQESAAALTTHKQALQALHDAQASDKATWAAEKAALEASHGAEKDAMVSAYNKVSLLIQRDVKYVLGLEEEKNTWAEERARYQDIIKNPEREKLAAETKRLLGLIQHTVQDHTKSLTTIDIVTSRLLKGMALLLEEQVANQTELSDDVGDVGDVDDVEPPRPKRQRLSITKPAATSSPRKGKGATSSRTQRSSSAK